MSNTEKNSLHYGGQAVIEGVMMRGRRHFAVACRRENKEVIVSREHLDKSILGRLKWLDKPFLRGTLAMIDTILLGMKALMFSANLAMEDAQAAEAAKKTDKDGPGHPCPGRPEQPAREVRIRPKRARAAEPGKQKAVNDVTLGITLFVGLGLGIALFMLAPTALTIQLKKSVTHSRLWLGLVEGGIKISLFIGYVWAISWMKDIRRIFQYHGAEHKIINAYEAGEDLTVENADRHTTVHVRCGTSFILIVLITSILIFSVIPWNTIWQRFLLKLVLLPVVAGIAYEVIKFAGRRKESALLRAILGPGLLMQRITTQPPTPDQVEVAIAALKAVLDQEKEDVRT